MGLALEQLFADAEMAVHAGDNIIILSDRLMGPDRVAIPALLAVPIEPATPALVTVAMEPATPALAAVAMDPATPTLRSVATDLTTPTEVVTFSPFTRSHCASVFLLASSPRCRLRFTLNAL